MRYDNSELNDEIDSIYVENKEAIEKDLVFEERAVFDQKMRQLLYHDLLVLFGGPVQTILTGTFGLIVLLYRRKRIRRNGLTILDWLAVFLSLFWLREVFNLVHSVLFELLFREGSYFGGDEKYISLAFNLPSGVVPIILGCIGLLISLFVIFKIIPRSLQFIFVLAGLIGGMGGFLLWFQVVGPVLLPMN